MSDALLHQPLRLKIMAALYAERDREAVDFPRLKRIVEATDGNLGSHLATLETAGYIATTKDFVGKKPRTRAALTPEGRRAFRAHVAYLREIIEAAEQ
ncbi:MAG: transcriptional regulator [Caulobacteraceae bacterium]